MTAIKEIINKHQSLMLQAGLLRPPGEAKKPSGRPSLFMVKKALQENPHLLAPAQPSPFSILFNDTLPKIEHILMNLGEEKAEEIIGKLCGHGREVIDRHGMKKARPYLEELFMALPQIEPVLNELGVGKTEEVLGKLYAHSQEVIAKHGMDKSVPHLKELFMALPGRIDKLKEERGMEELIHAYYLFNFEGDDSGFLLLDFKGYINTLEKENGLISLKMKNNVTDEILAEIIKRSKKISRLDLSGCELITDVGLGHLKSLTKLQYLDLRNGSVLISQSAINSLKDALPGVPVLTARARRRGI